MRIKTMDNSRVQREIDQQWDDEIVPNLVEYIRIPNKSPMFDADWVQNGYMDAAVKLMLRWAQRQPIAGMQIEVVKLPARTPLIFIEVPGFAGWSEDSRVGRECVRSCISRWWPGHEKKKKN